MAFKSAELKKLYERLRDAGYAISASRAARLFRHGELAALVKSVIDEETQRRQTEAALDATLKEIARMENDLARYKTGLQQAKNQVVLASRRYLDLQLEIEQLKASIPDIAELQGRAKYYRSMIASLDYQIMQPGTSGDYLAQLQSLRAQMFANLGKVEKEIEENQAKWNEIKAKEAQRDQWGYLSETYRRLADVLTEKIDALEKRLDQKRAELTGLKTKKQEQELAIEIPGDRIIL